MRELNRRTRIILIATAALVAGGGAAAIYAHRDDESEEAEERERSADHFWRLVVAIEGEGRVRSTGGEPRAIDCSSDGHGARGTCGPKLLRFKELAPPLIEATAAPGFRFERWESRIRSADGAIAPREGPMPDGRFYLNGMGYADTGALDMVTAVFVRENERARDDAAIDAGADAQLGVQP